MGGIHTTNYLRGDPVPNTCEDENVTDSYLEQRIAISQANLPGFSRPGQLPVQWTKIGAACTADEGRPMLRYQRAASIAAKVSWSEVPELLAGLRRTRHAMNGVISEGIALGW